MHACLITPLYFDLEIKHTVHNKSLTKNGLIGLIGLFLSFANKFKMNIRDTQRYSYLYT